MEEDSIRRQSCDNCKNNNADWYCKKCDMFLCQRCRHLHDNWNAFASHQTISCDEVHHVTTTETSTTLGSHESKLSIHRHHDEDLDKLKQPSLITHEHVQFTVDELSHQTAISHDVRVHRVTSTKEITTFSSHESKVSIHPDHDEDFDKLKQLITVDEPKQSAYVEPIQCTGLSEPALAVFCTMRRQVFTSKMLDGNYFVNTTLSSDELKGKVSDHRPKVSDYYYLLSDSNVVSLSYQLKDDKSTMALHIGVINEDKSIPDITPEIPFVVFEEGENCALHGGPPYVGGSLISLLNCDQEYIKDPDGTWGFTLLFRNKRIMFSAAHVLTQFDRNNVGKTMSIACCKECANNYRYNFHNEITILDQVDVTLYDPDHIPSNPVPDDQDLAWAGISNEHLAHPLKLQGFDDVQPPREAVDKERINFLGGVSGNHLKGYVYSVTALAKVGYESSSGKKIAIFKMVGRICLDKDNPLYMVEHGDSGSAVIATTDNAIVGIVISKTKQFVYFSNVYYVMDRFT